MNKNIPEKAWYFAKLLRKFRI